MLVHFWGVSGDFPGACLCRFRDISRNFRVYQKSSGSIRDLSVLFQGYFREPQEVLGTAL